MRALASRLRVAAAITVMLLLGACSGGINAGEEGGVAFIAFTGMLILTIAVLYYFLGRED
jgi:hypothetical protein